MAVHWLALHASTAGDTSSIPGLGTKIAQASQHGQKKKKKKNEKTTETLSPSLKELKIPMRR